MRFPRAGLLLCGLGLFFGSGQGWSQAAVPADAHEPPAFQELWAYLSVGEESFWRPDLPVSDLGYFSATLNSWGELSGVPDVTKLKAFQGRKHLVVAVLENSAQTHMALHPGFPVRAQLLDDLIKATGPYDGLQLDFESVHVRDKEAFWSFLAELKLRLPGKVLSVAVPARTSLRDDAYDYRVLDRTVDRIVVMAYDQHWSGGPPGPVSSVDWGRRVAAFAQSVIGPAKLVVGVPFYGRAWGDKSVSRAYKASGIAQLLGLRDPATLGRTDGIPHFEYEETVKVKVFFDDRESHRLRLGQYTSLGVKNLAFWRLGQEFTDFWSLLRLAPGAPGH